MTNPLEVPTRRLDEWQQRYRPTAFVIAVFKKYADDRGNNMAASLTFHAFVAVAPLLLLFFTILGFLLPSNAGLRRTITNSALSDFPVIGSSLHSRSLHGSVPAVVVGLLVSLWGATGVTRTFQWAMADIWNVPGKRQSDFAPRQVRGVLFLCLITSGVAATATLNAIGSLLNLGSWGAVVLAFPAAAVNIGLIYLSFYVLTPGARRRSELLPGAIIAGIGYELLQTAGVNLIMHTANQAGEFYQTFGVVVGFLAFVYFAAQLILLSAEYNVVRAWRLWPRNLQQPPFTTADRIQLQLLARREERAHGVRVTVRIATEKDKREGEEVSPGGNGNATGGVPAGGPPVTTQAELEEAPAGSQLEGLAERRRQDQTAPPGRVVER